MRGESKVEPDSAWGDAKVELHEHGHWSWAWDCKEETQKDEFQPKDSPSASCGLGETVTQGWASGAQRRPPATPRGRGGCGMSFEGLHPKTALANFLRRYFSRSITKQDCYYKCQVSTEGFVATLLVPCYNDKKYIGHERPTEKEAEKSAAERFLEDADVVHAAANLVDSMRSIKRQVKSDPQVAKRKRETTIRDICHEKYNNQAEQGRRNAIWDGRA